MSYTVGSCFAGIGGFEIGFERAGFEIAWQIELDPWCRRVLAKNFPKAERFNDIRECGAHNLSPVDVVVGGFPCQDISNAGLRAGITGERSGLWGEMVRTIRMVRPKVSLVENVAALLGRGMGTVLGDLSEIGNDAEWDCISAADVGAPHLRERVWIMAYATSEQDRGIQFAGLASDSSSVRARGGDFWAIEPPLGRVVDGLSPAVDELRGLGNAVVPQIPEMYARRIREVLDQEAK